MKKTALLIIALFITSASFAQGLLSLFNRSDEFFKLMQDKKFNEAHAFFDPVAQTKISTADLEKLWVDLDTKLGKFESSEPVQNKVQGDLFVVTVEGKFAYTTQNFTLAFNKAEKLVGFFVQPPSNTQNYLNPAYADTTLYSQKEIYIKSPGHSLVGILTAPKNSTNYPLVVLVHGNGPNDMDATVGPNKPFKDLAAGLASKGIASIRYVKRTMIYQGEFAGAFTVKEETIDDAVAAIALARTTPGVDKKQIYLLGHSLGGTLAPRIAALAPDLNGVIIAEATSRKFTDLLVEQNKYMFDQAKDTTQLLKKEFDTLLTALNKSRITTAGTMKPDSLILGLPVSYWVDLNLYNQVEAAKNIKQRILIIQGENDFEVTVNDYNLWKSGLSSKSNATFKLYPDLNHLLSSQLEKGNQRQYQAASSVSESLIIDIVNWIKSK